MRLFLALDVTPAVADAVDGWIRRLVHRLGSRGVHELKFVDASRLHLTLHFFGEVPDKEVDGLRTALTSPFEERAYDLELGTADTFPSSRDPRVLWLGLAQGGDETRALQAEVEERLRAAAFASPLSDRRPFSAHLTVARVRRDARSGLGRELAAALEAEPPPAGRWRADRVTLYRSHLSPRGPRYEALLHVPLSPER